MKTIYHCGNCGARNEFDVPKSISLKYGAADVLAGNAPGFSINMWIRHECATDLHGIAPLIAVVDD